MSGFDACFRARGHIRQIGGTLPCRSERELLLPAPPRDVARSPYRFTSGSGYTGCMRIQTRFTLLLITLGLIGVASLLVLPVETLGPEAPPLPTGLIRALSLIQPLLLTIGAGYLGTRLAPKVSLDAPAIRLLANGRSPMRALLRQLGRAVPVAVVVGLLLIAYGITFETFVASAENDALARIEALKAPAVVRVLYGGITEEIIARWGIMTLVVWIVWRLTGRPARPSRSAYGIGMAVAALLFAAGHLPILHAALLSPPLWLVVFVIAANSLAGLAFGLLFVRDGLEAAMLGHALAHVVAMGFGVLLRL